MRAEDFGIDPKFGTHNRQLTPAENKFLGILWIDHAGSKNAIPADALADKFLPEMPLELAKRSVREMHNHLLMMHTQIPLLSKAGPGGGYYIAEDTRETENFYHTFRQRGMTGLRKASRGKQSEMVGMVQQLSFEFDDLEDKTSGYVGYVKPRATAPTPVEVVDAFLEKMLQNPEKFSDGLRKIGEKYGSVLLPKGQLAAIRAKVQELNAMAEILG